MFSAVKKLRASQGKAIKDEPVFSIETLESHSPPAPFTSCATTASTEKPQILAGIKVLDLSRVIAGPVISRTLAEYGASVLKITSATLPDVPYYQVDLNFGKRTADLNLRNAEDRKKFEALLDDGVDVIIDGYRTGALERLGYGVQSLKTRFAGRGKGFVYVAENCFGFKGPWKDRSGWQPVADAVNTLPFPTGYLLTYSRFLDSHGVTGKLWD
jgi:crotonobetainyl-CoA:carnitine CoA-transferase CaiB-like acyl-CoA transferase